MDGIREMFAGLCATWAVASEPLAGVEDRTIPGPAGPVPVRVYTPVGDGPLPVLVFFHGGAFFIGSIDTHDPVCRELAARSGWLVVSVEYRLAPEHPYPAGVDDCFAALQWCAANAASIGGDAGHLAVAGDSAGGNLAAVCALRARDEGGPELDLQVLLYPVTDAACATPSMTRNGEGYFLTAGAMQMSWGLYAPDEQTRSDAYASPLRAPDLSGVAAALVITAEFDPLVDEGDAYAKRLFDAGVPVELTQYDGMIHGFVQMLAITPRATEAIDQVAASLHRVVDRAG
jgi:acetyl esterase